MNSLSQAGSTNESPWRFRKFGEGNMGKYIAYILCILVIIFALEYFQIVDIPYLELADIQTKGEEYKEKSEDNMRRRFGD